MALKDKVQTALDENRMLVLGCQVLLGAQFRVSFDPGFARLPQASQTMALVGLFALAICFALLVLPSTYHRIVEGGNDTWGLLRLSTGLMWPALGSFIAGMGSVLFIAGDKLFGRGAAWGMGALGVAIAAGLLFGLELVLRRRRRGEIESMVRRSQEEPEKPSPVKDRIRHVLTEARLVLPGAQALLGFQFSIILTDAFDRLPRSSRLLHLGAFASVAVAMVLLLAPAAYHRIVEGGEDTEAMHRFASAMVLAASVPLGLGVALDTFVVVRRVTGSAQLAGWSAGLLLTFTWGLWFGLTLVERRRHRARAGFHGPRLPVHP